ncbi:cell division cycle protein 20 homolog B isoform X5 [Mus musculus]|uniref:cell division cycle protein 20 homolog B isoform X5 n=1 Tax=Mus musculus TaxID=10090 RepID=UPI0005AB9F3D|nr:cell division cycle protein 20 homolog B isoform X5 [Mus musculus]|eukprot:XP_011242964.1 PREDICTED: cell division cycle protein 20 homolog B isoform X5 [Mus musculus]
MEWKLQRTARRKIRTEEEMLWENIMRVLANGMKQQRNQGSPKELDSVAVTYSSFKSNFVKRLSAEIPVASSPITTRWQLSPARDPESSSSVEEGPPSHTPESLASGLKITPAADTLTLRSHNKNSPKTLSKGSSEVNNSTLRFCKTPLAGDRGWKENLATKGQRCLNQPFSTQKGAQQIDGKMHLCEESRCVRTGCRFGARDEFYLRRFSGVYHSTCQPEVKIHLTGLRNDYYLNTLDWSSQNLVAVALGTSVYIWNGQNHSWIENIDLSVCCHYVSSVTWMREGSCLAVGTSEGEVQLWDAITKKQLRNLHGHLSVVGALSWNHCTLSSGSRLGRVHHHDVRVAQHRVGTLYHKEAVCSLKWSPDGRLLSSGCNDGLLTIWPHDPGAGVQGLPLKVIPQSTAVKAMEWCPWQSEVLAVGGGVKDGCLHVLDINTGKNIQTPSTQSQICSLIWLPKTKEIATGQGAPKNDVALWTCPTLFRSGGFFEKQILTHPHLRTQSVSLCTYGCPETHGILPLKCWN